MSTAGDYFGCLGGQEIWNLCRTQRLMADGFGPQGMICRNCGCCEDVPGGLGYPNGYGIQDAPWYDPNTPESAEFAGLLVTKVEGLEGGRFGRTSTDTGGGSTVFGRGRRAAPTITVTGLLMASTCCGMDFGLQWLADALGVNSGCQGSNGCLGDDFTFLTCLPLAPDEDCLVPAGAFTTQSFPLADVADNFLPMPTTVRPIPLPALTPDGRYKLTLTAQTATVAQAAWTMALREVGINVVRVTKSYQGTGAPQVKTIEYEFVVEGGAPATFQAEFSAGNGNGGININNIVATIEAVTFDREEWLAPYFRTYKRAVVTEGPYISQMIPRGCPECYDCCTYEVTFTIQAGNPCRYRDPIDIGTEGFLCTFEDECKIDWIPPYPGRNCKDFQCSDDTTDCGTDPTCTVTKPPSIPTPSPATGCAPSCEPSSELTCCSELIIDSSVVPDHTSATLRIEIFAGSQPMRNVKIKLWANPLSLPTDELDDCDACAILGIGYIKEETTLVIDGATRTSTIECAGGQSVRASRFLSNSGKNVGIYPDIACGNNNYTLQVCSPQFVAADATLHAELIIKEGC